MRRLVSLMTVLLVNCIAFAGVWTPETLPIPKNTYDSTFVSYVSNPDDVLSPSEVDDINDVMFTLERDYDVRGLVIAVQEIDPDDPYEFTMAVANKHGIGGRNNTGIVLMLATDSRAIQILTGDGMEKYITDAQCSRIERKIVVPLLKEQRWGEALLAGAQAFVGVCAKQPEFVEALNNDDDDDDSNALLWVGGGFAGLIGLGIFAARRASKCPKCGKNHYKHVLRQTVLAPGVPGAPSKSEVDQLVDENMLMIQAGKMDCLRDVGEELVTEEDTAFNNGMTHEERERLNSQSMGIVRGTIRDALAKARQRNVRVIDVYRCSDCGHEVRKEKMDTTYNFALGVFTSGAFGAISHESSSSGSGRSWGSSGSGRSWGSSGGGRSWGSSGGGHFSGGGAGGRF